MNRYFVGRLGDREIALIGVDMDDALETARSMYPDANMAEVSPRLYEEACERMRKAQKGIGGSFGRAKCELEVDGG